MGCGSAVPTMNKNPTSQLLNVQERYLLLDCGEGTQMQLRKFKKKLQKISHIFISHLHGDHYLGLVGLLSTFHLLGRKAPIYIYGPDSLKKILDLHFQISGTKLTYQIYFRNTNPKIAELIMEDKVLEVHSFPLDHSIDCCGFIIKEKLRERGLNKTVINKLNIPVEKLKEIKKGADLKLHDKIIENSKLTIDPPSPRSYAYCSDTKYNESIIEYIFNVDLLYHEATFLEKMRQRADKTCHSTAKDAATIALKSGVRKLLLGHYSARYKNIEEFQLEAGIVFENVVAVKDGDCFEIEVVK